MLFGLLNLSLWGYFAATLILTQITLAAVTLYLHRCQAHRSIDLNPIIAHFFRFWLWLTTGMITKEWVAIHRKHHVFVDQTGDPHSPKVYGIKRVFWRGSELYREESTNKETLEKFGKGTPNDWLERKIYSPLNWLGITTMLVIDLILFGLAGISIWGIQMIWIPIWAAGVINGIGHYWGYRNHESADTSRNIIPFAFIVCGEELHNNHHTFPNSAKLSLKWWEFDLGWFYIKTLSFFKLAKIRNIPPQLKRNMAKATIDTETLKALIYNRFQILSRYTKDVILPVFKLEKKQASQNEKRWFKQCKALLIRESSLIDENNQSRLSMLLEKYQNLKLVYSFRENLKTICQNQAANHQERIDAIKSWCLQAEASGIKALQDFAKTLTTYVTLMTTAEGT